MALAHPRPGLRHSGRVTETGMLADDLALPFCPECSSPLGNRMLMTAPSGCGTCDEAITRHRCTGRPDILTLAAGESWECPDCGSTWTVKQETWPCMECGQPRKDVTWDYREGDRIAAAPRYEPVALTPYRNRVPRARGKCYRTPGGSMVHVQPDCRCRS